MDTCPITGEPLLNPGQTVSHHALQTLRTQTNNIVGLRFDYQQALTAHRPTEVHVRMPARSNPPLNLHLVDQCSDHWDTLLVWAAEIMAYVNPLIRVPNNQWATIEAIYQQHTLSLATWTYAPTMCDETLDALTQLTRATYPTSNTRATVEHLDIADMWLTITPACQAVTMHSGRRLPTSTLDQWGTSGKVRHYGTPRRYSLEDALNMHNRRDKTA